MLLVRSNYTSRNLRIAEYGSMGRWGQVGQLPRKSTALQFQEHRMDAYGCAIGTMLRCIRSCRIPMATRSRSQPIRRTTRSHDPGTERIARVRDHSADRRDWPMGLACIWAWNGTVVFRPWVGASVAR